MTHKTTMPEPVVWLYHDYPDGFPPSDNAWMYGNHVYSVKRLPGSRNETGLITTAQAEAYKDACVRDALEEAAMILKANAEACHSDTRIMLRANAEAILSLIKRIA